MRASESYNRTQKHLFSTKTLTLSTQAAMSFPQPQLFDLPEKVSYINAAYMSPLTKQVAAIGEAAIRRKLRPYEIQPIDFFTEVEMAKKCIAQLISCPTEQVALIPSVSYGMANVAKNVTLEKGEEVLMVEEQFPSNVYAWKRLVDERGGTIKNHLLRRWYWLTPIGGFKSQSSAAAPQSTFPAFPDTLHISLFFLRPSLACWNNTPSTKSDCPNMASSSSSESS